MGFLRKGLGRQRKGGHAITEAVIMLPFLAMMWGLYMYVGDVFEALSLVGTETRRAAMVHIFDNCGADEPLSLAGLVAEPAPARRAERAVAALPNLLVDVASLEDENLPANFQVGTYVGRTTVDGDAVVQGASMTTVPGSTFVCCEHRDQEGELDFPLAADDAWDTYGRPAW